MANSAGRPAFFTEEQVLRVFEYQGLITKAQAAQLIYHKIDPTPTEIAIVFRILNNLHDPKKQKRAEGLIWRSDIQRPWLGKKTGKPEVYFGLEDGGAKELNKLTGGKQHKIDASSAVTSMQHSLALIDIATRLMNNAEIVKCNRQVNILTKNGELQKLYIKPDVQVSYKNNPSLIQFIEYEHLRSQEEIDDLILERMRKWQALFNSPEGNKYDKDILLLFWHGDGKIDDGNLFVWIKALYRLIKENNDVNPPFNIYYREFQNFLAKPSTELKDYTLLIPGEDPETAIAQAEREAYLKSAADHCFFDPHNMETIDLITKYDEQKHALFSHMQNTSTRQQYFFEVVRLMYKKGNNDKDKLTGFATASLPWPSIGLVRFWLTLPENKPLRAALIKPISEIQGCYSKGLYVAQDAIERMVWNTLFRYFGFGKGGNLSFYTIQTEGEADKNRYGGITPIVTIKTPWDDLFEDKDKAKPTVDAITWLISLLVTYYPELGLVKEKSISFYSDELTEELSGHNDII